MNTLLRSGTGKSVLVASFLNRLDPEVYAPANVVGFSAQTTANMVQVRVECWRMLSCFWCPCQHGGPLCTDHSKHGAGVQMA